MRFISAAAVIKEHADFHIGGPRILDFGWLGVDMFFVLSGFLIVTLLLRERERTGGISLAKFYARRSLRIFPVYYFLIFAVFGCYLTVYAWFPNGLRYYGWAFPVLLTYTQDLIMVPLGVFNPTWSLAIEEQFYLFWPLVEKIAANKFKWTVFSAFFVGNELVEFGYASKMISWLYGTDQANKLPIYLITFTPILTGVLLAHLLNTERIYSGFSRVLGNRYSAALVVIILIVSFELFPLDIQGFPRLIVHVLMALLVASLAIFPENLLSPLLDNPISEKLGTISYGLYLYHLMVMSVLAWTLRHFSIKALDSWVLFILTLISTSLVAGLSYRFIEQPFLSLKSRYVAS